MWPHPSRTVREGEAEDEALTMSQSMDSNSDSELWSITERITNAERTLKESASCANKALATLKSAREGASSSMHCPEVKELMDAGESFKDSMDILVTVLAPVSELLCQDLMGFFDTWVSDPLERFMANEKLWRVAMKRCIELATTVKLTSEKYRADLDQVQGRLQAALQGCQQLVRRMEEEEAESKRRQAAAEKKSDKRAMACAVTTVCAGLDLMGGGGSFTGVAKALFAGSGVMAVGAGVASDESNEHKQVAGELRQQSEAVKQLCAQVDSGLRPALVAMEDMGTNVGDFFTKVQQQLKQLNNLGGMLRRNSKVCNEVHMIELHQKMRGQARDIKKACENYARAVADLRISASSRFDGEEAQNRRRLLASSWVCGVARVYGWAATASNVEFMREAMESSGFSPITASGLAPYPVLLTAKA